MKHSKTKEQRVESQNRSIAAQPEMTDEQFKEWGDRVGRNWSTI